MKTIKGTITEQNLLKAFAGESQARNRYSIFAEVAKKEGYEQISGIFLETADQEKAHAKRFFDYLYADFSGIAADEGFKNIATAFKMIAKVEEFHEWRYRKLLARVEDKMVFKREEPIKWQCRNCGFVHEGKTPPEKCPACLHPKDFFEPKRDNY